jgi:hypothetical protein
MRPIEEKNQIAGEEEEEVEERRETEREREAEVDSQRGVHIHAIDPRRHAKLQSLRKEPSEFGITEGDMSRGLRVIQRTDHTRESIERHADERILEESRGRTGFFQSLAT